MGQNEFLHCAWNIEKLRKDSSSALRIQEREIGFHKTPRKKTSVAFVGASI